MQTIEGKYGNGARGGSPDCSDRTLQAGHDVGETT